MWRGQAEGSSEVHLLSTGPWRCWPEQGVSRVRLTALRASHKGRHLAQVSTRTCPLTYDPRPGRCRPNCKAAGQRPRVAQHEGGRTWCYMQDPEKSLQ